MAVVKHPDTYLCDICGREIRREWDVHKVAAPYLSDTAVDEHGSKEKVVSYGSREFDLCGECVRKATVIREAPRFYQEPMYELRRTCDCDALLALAEEMDKTAPDYSSWEVCEGTDRSITDEVRDYASRIREACGEDGEERQGR